MQRNFKNYSQKIFQRGTIETTYSDGVATFAYIPYEVEYGFATGYGDVNLSVNFKATTGGGTVTATAPKILTTILNEGVTGISYLEELYATGIKPITWSIIEGTLPDGLSFDTKTAAITGTPLEECTDRKIKITASNMAGDDSKEFYLNVKGVAAAITTKSLPSGAKNTAYSTPITYTGTAPITLTATGLPSGLELVDGVITGSPTEGGTFNVVITASNNTKTVTKKFKLQINEPPFFNDTSLKDATAGKSYSHKFNVTGTKTITFKLSNWSLPSGLALNAKNGTLKGKPTASGDFTFTITATNAQGYSSKEFNLAVKGVAPKISGSLKKGKVGQSYTATLKSTGTSPITWIFDGELPDGIDFSNETFRGTPTEAFDGYVSVSAVNSGGTDTKNLRLVITSPKTAKGVSSVMQDTQEANSAENFALQINRRNTKIFFGQERKISSVTSIKILDGYKIAAALPEIFVTESGLYDLEVEIAHEIETGTELKWLACSQNAEPSEDDEIAEFYDVDGAEISVVPENHKITVSAWLNENIIYEPLIIVKNN